MGTLARMEMLHTQVQRSVEITPWNHRGCHFCSEVCRFSSVSCLGKSPSRELRVFAVWQQFGSTRGRRGRAVRCPTGFLLSRSSSRILAGSMEGIMEGNMESTSEPLIAEDVPMNPSVEGEAAAVNQYSSSTVALPPMHLGARGLVELSVVDKVLVLFGFLACTASLALFALIVTAIPTFNAMRRAAVSVEKLADMAREELPGTMAAVRLSGMEISDLTLELNDLSQEISDGVRSSARAVRAAEVGIRRIGLAAASQTFARLQETASVPVQVVKPAVVSAAATTLHAVTQAQKLVFGLASSSYPRISGWLGRKGSSGKEFKPVGGVSSSASTPTDLLKRQETSAAAILAAGQQLSLFDDADGDVTNLIEVSSGKQS